MCTKKKWFKMLIACLAVLTILFSTLTGCSKTNNDNETTESAVLASEEPTDTAQETETPVTEIEETSTMPTEVQTEPATEPATEAHTEAPTEAPTEVTVTKETETEKPSPIPVVTVSAPPATEPAISMLFEDVDETVYANTTVNIRTGPSTSYKKVGSLSYGDSIKRTGIGDGWSRVNYNEQVCYMCSDYIQTTEPPVREVYDGSYPMTYSDGGVNITIYKEWYGSTAVYAAHVTMNDYSRFRGEYLGGRYLSSAASNKVLGINGDWASPNGYTEIRGGKVIVQSNIPEGAYSASTGKLWYAQRGYSGATETFCFGPAFLIDGSIHCNSDGGRAQRTFIGTNGNPGDLWLCVSDGRGIGGSPGLTAYECAAYLQSKGCTFGVPLDGGGSTEMVFQGKILNTINGERALNDALYITY